MDRELIGRGFAALAEGLGPFVDERMRAVHPTGDWLADLRARDVQRYGRAHQISLSDPALLLRVLVVQWHVFDGKLPVVARAYAGELRDTRNRWAHNEPFTDAGIRRALDTMELLLREAGAAEAAHAVRRLLRGPQPARQQSPSPVAPDAATPAEAPDATDSTDPTAGAGEWEEDSPESGEGRPRRQREGSETRGRRHRSRARADSAQEPGTDDDDGSVLVPVAGILDVLDNYAFIRTSGYLPGPKDVYVSLAQTRKYRLRKGDAVVGAIRIDPHRRQRDRYNALAQLDLVNGTPPSPDGGRPAFDDLTPIAPQERLFLETRREAMMGRMIDLVAPIGKGQRGLVAAPPKAGRITILHTVAEAVHQNNPECHLMVLLVDQPPERITEMQRTMRGELITTTSDRPAEDHLGAAELAVERAKRLAEMGHDAVVLLDSLTSLVRAYNLCVPASGRLLPGGLDPLALHPAKRLFTSARNIEDGGSLTIVATAMEGTGSRMNETIAEEFRGLATMELRIARRPAHTDALPVIDIKASGTRREELLDSPEQTAIARSLRHWLSGWDTDQAMDVFRERLAQAPTNLELLLEFSKASSRRHGD
ncbi:transcription termination factor Rho [Streptomyces sp. NPDC049040]|uniref:transcription termination factor Rho n=1 Tax=Streptomyces sp. NPDC049040 TaxID=3365593 RepID=UPI00371A01F7